MTLQRVNEIAGIVGVVFAILWGVWIYVRPPEASSAPTASQPYFVGNQSVQIQGGNNMVGGHLSESEKNLDDYEARLRKLTTGVSRSFVEKNFGSPVFDDAITDLGLRNLIFAFSRFFLQIVTSNDGRVVFYAVTSRSPDFRPTIPKLGGKLLDTKFSEMGEPESATSHWSSKEFSYAEKFYLGNLGGYKDFYVGYCPAGVLVYEKYFEYSSVGGGSVASKEFRMANSPNCFGVGELSSGNDEIIKSVGLGLDRSAANDLPGD